MQLISYCEPRNVMLVHGEMVKMQFLKQKIKQVRVTSFPRVIIVASFLQEHGIECYMPANGETATISTPVTINAFVQEKLLREEAET